jgi:hypothetical protein
MKTIPSTANLNELIVTDLVNQVVEVTKFLKAFNGSPIERLIGFIAVGLAKAEKDISSDNVEKYINHLSDAGGHFCLNDALYYAEKYTLTKATIDKFPGEKMIAQLCVDEKTETNH